MNLAEQQFLYEVEQFRLWTRTVPTEKQYMEWEYAYPDWANIYKATADFIAAANIDEEQEAVLDRLLYIIAADNGSQIIAYEVAKFPDKLIQLAAAAIHATYTDAKWQLAIELGNLSGRKQEVERLLTLFAKDDDEYTRRRALGALAEAGSPLVNDLIESAWDSNHEYQRMTALSALQKISSSELDKYLALADLDGREYLVAWAARIRRGEMT